MQVPETRYARVGDICIAYQMWGEGPPLIIIPAFISNIEICWEHELYQGVEKVRLRGSTATIVRRTMATAV